jgi:peptidoglycan/xylan/chitin deacetylase (PgdA/CDA1 family)
MAHNHNPKSFASHTLSLALVFIMFFSILNLGEMQPIIPILGFHGISNSQSEEMDYPQKDLEQLLEYLIQHNYWFLTTQDLYDFFLTKTRKIPIEYQNQKPIMLTFDDGYKTIHTRLLPILSKLEKKYNNKVKVVLFINPGTLANEKSIASTHLGCAELRTGLKKGFYDIQSHGQNHLNLTEISRQQIVSELLRARIDLRKCTQDLDPEQKVASHLAYPYGAYNKQLEKYVAKYYLSGYLYNDEILNYSCMKNHYKIPRLMVNRQKTTKELIAITKTNQSINKKNKC